MAVLASWCVRHRYIVIGLWVALLIALGAGGQAAGTSYSDVFDLPGTESARALKLLQASLPAVSGEADQIVVHTSSGTVRDPAIQRRVSSMLDAVGTIDQVESVASPYQPAGAAQISRDGATAFATVQFAVPFEQLDLANVQSVMDTAERAGGDGLTVALGGQAIDQLTQAPPGSSELIGIVAGAIILFIAFGSFLGMLIPLLVAVAALGGGLAAIGLLSHVITLGTVSPTLAALIGLGVGIDYALFIVTRHRAGLFAGMTPHDAAVRALNTSGRAVLFAGATVVIALLGLLVLRLSFLNGLGIGAAVAVVFTVVAAVTLLPALLGVLGQRVLSGRQRRKLAEQGPHAVGASGAWASWSDLVARHKSVLSIVTLLVIAVLSIPVASIRLGSSDAGNMPEGTTTRTAYDLLASGFGPGFNGPLQAVAELNAPGDAQALDRLVTTLRQTPGVAAAQALPAEPGAKIAIVSIIPATAPQDEATDDLIDHLREDVIPAAERGSAMQVSIGGVTAIFKDFAGVLTGKLPLFLGVIVVLGFLLLMLAFRSIVVPLTAALMNVLATAASFGVIVAVFQWGWGASLLGTGKGGPVEAFVPVIMLAILFGLSMDYQVFLVSRMHEEWVHTGDNRRAVMVGQAQTGRVVTAAALIMICVFGSFVIGGTRVISEFGLGLAVAVAIDAFLLRTVLVPALMHLFGTANWWLPGWLDAILPHLSVEPADEAEITDPATEVGEPVPTA
jgi:putative drug exporter of the RND superfamily